MKNQLTVLLAERTMGNPKSNACVRLFGQVDTTRDFGAAPIEKIELQIITDGANRERNIRTVEVGGPVVEAMKFYHESVEVIMENLAEQAS